MKNKKSIALGTFDGLHTGHLAVIAQGADVVLTFDSHPLETLGKAAPPALIDDDLFEKKLKSLGVGVERIPFGEIRDMTPGEFVREVLVKKLSATDACCGSNYRFGKNASGGVGELKALCAEAGIAVHVAESVTFGGEPVSSTRIRQAVTLGDMRGASAMLGRLYGYESTVIRGDARGRTLGFATANQRVPERMAQPARGVYASFAVLDGAVYPAMTNIGVRPTIGDPGAGSETHIIGFAGDIYGRRLRVCLVERIREETAFPSLDALKAQLESDREKCRVILEKEEPIWL